MKSKIGILLLSLFIFTRLYPQTSDSTGKQKLLLRVYKGGRLRYSRVSVKLYADSTYHYFNWYHFGRIETDTGKYLLTDTTLFLCSKECLFSKQAKQSNKTCIFTGQKFRIQNKSLLLFTKKQERKDKSDFYRLYFTLHRVK